MMQREYPIEPAANTFGDTVERWQVSICMERDSEVTNLHKLQREYSIESVANPVRGTVGIASEHICALSIGCMLTVHSSIGNTRSSQWQTLRESLSDDGK